jgi:hypothetical protein
MSDLMQFGHWLNQPATNLGVMLSAVLIVWFGTYAIHSAFKFTFVRMLRDATQKLEKIEQGIDSWCGDWTLLHEEELESRKTYEYDKAREERHRRTYGGP